MSNQCSEFFLEIINPYSSVSKSNQSHVDVFRRPSLKWDILKKISKMIRNFLEVLVVTGYFSNLTNSYVTTMITTISTWNSPKLCNAKFD